MTDPARPEEPAELRAARFVAEKRLLTDAVAWRELHEKDPEAYDLASMNVKDWATRYIVLADHVQVTLNAEWLTLIDQRDAARDRAQAEHARVERLRGERDRLAYLYILNVPSDIYQVLRELRNCTVTTESIGIYEALAAHDAEQEKP